ncbi:MAG: class I SAM-dependent methyltransferase, partial [Chitinophagaceae bacterium]
RYLRFRKRAANSKGHGMHSPFVFTLITKVLNDKSIYPEYAVVENLRGKLLRDTTMLPIRELGAGSSMGQGSERTVASITRNSAKQVRLAQLLFRIARFYKPATVLELGTSLGISSAYLKLANPDATVTSMEGSPEVAATAGDNLRSVGAGVNIIEGNFDDTLPVFLAGNGPLDLVFIDGNHRREPTERYFEWLLPHIHNDSILVFDDVHWSAEMEAAWKTIRSHETVRCSVDLFYIGLVFFRKEFREKQAFDIRF